MSFSLCVLRIEIDEDLPEMGDNPGDAEAAKEQKKKDRGCRDSKTITVETYASILMSSGSDPGILPTSSRRSTPDNASGSDEDTISFFCGNPLVEVTKGVLHLYKENELREAQEAKTLCLLSVPGALGARDLLAFAAACQQDIAHVRVLRDGSPDNYMALITFRTSQAAHEFHSAFDGVPYSSLEPNALCHTAWVSRVEWARAGTAPPLHTELPTCPVCLERMDESVAGVLSPQCAHAFHTDCLLRWGDASCPVCRAAQTPEPAPSARCLHCLQHEDDEDTKEDNVKDLSGVAEGQLDGVEASALWICLICGHVGCGRYENGHAAKHFKESNHTYALQLGSNRVWDYAGDNFVHRLLQNKPDGKLVAGGAAADKSEAAQRELTHLLTAQLDAQRDYFLARIDKMESEHKAESSSLRARAESGEAAAAALRAEAAGLQRDNKALDKRLQQLTTKLSSLQSELADERGLTAALASSQAEWQAAAKVKEAAFVQEVADLREQLRDVMFFVEARGRLQGAADPELQGASVSVAPAPAQKNRRRRHR